MIDSRVQLAASAASVNFALNVLQVLSTNSRLLPSTQSLNMNCMLGTEDAYLHSVIDFIA